MLALAAKLKRLGLLTMLLAAATMLTTAVADARVGGGGSMGSRGFKTWTKPPSTNTAPKSAQPVDRTITPQTGKPSISTAVAPQSRFGGLGKLLMGGLIAGALASIFGFGALASVLGFVLQIALIGGIIWLALTWWRNRNGQQPAVAGAGATSASRPQNVNYRAADMNAGYGGAAVTEVKIQPADYEAFERLLSEIQSGYGRNDLKALESRTTPEMHSYFAEQLAANAKRGVRNEVSGAKLLQGDLAEAWREGNLDYATVAMRFSLVDATVDIASGRVVDGNKTTAQEVTEIWTFCRPANGGPSKWELSAIQQTA